jgi:hypothetical protein
MKFITYLKNKNKNKNTWYQYELQAEFWYPKIWLTLQRLVEVLYCNGFETIGWLLIQLKLQGLI